MLLMLLDMALIMFESILLFALIVIYIMSLAPSPTTYEAKAKVAVLV